MLSESQKKERAEKCGSCYFCQVGVDKSVSIDDMKTQKAPEGSNRAEKCGSCYFCQVGVDKSVSIDDVNKKKKDEPTFCWYIFPTNACNLRCSYCYANNQPGKMTVETMHKTLTWLFEKQPHKYITCHFFGGEPTTMWDMLVDMVEIGNVMAKNNGRKVIWSMTTNGTLLTPERLDWLGERFRKKNPFLLSIDGRPETHNKHRVDAQGNGTHHLIPVDEILSRFPTIECRPTIKTDTVKDWFEDFRWLRNKGFKAIAIEPDYEEFWSAESLYDYEQLMRKLAHYYVLAVKVGQTIPMKFIKNVVDNLKSPAPPGGKMCGVGLNCGGLDHRGKLYACQRYASYNEPDKYSLGDVENGWDELKLLEAQNLSRFHVQGDISEGFNCATCEVRQFCNKGCNAANIKFMGRRDVALPNYCRLTKIEVRAALDALMELGLVALRQTQKQQGQACSCK